MKCRPRYSVKFIYTVKQQYKELKQNREKLKGRFMLDYIHEKADESFCVTL